MHLPLALPGRANRPVDVVGFGLNSVDLLAVVPQPLVANRKQRVRRFALRPGGQAATAMRVCATLGWRTRYVGRFGDDAHGVMARASLSEAGVDLAAARTIAGAANQFAVILVDEATGQRTIFFDRDARLRIDPAQVSLEAVLGGRVLLVDCHETGAATRAAQLARGDGVPTVIDVERPRPGIEDLLAHIDVILAAEEFPAALTGVGELGAALRMIARNFPARVVGVTLGAQGSLALVDGQEVRTAAPRIEAVDTTGAGDAFRAGFIAGWLAAGPLATAEAVLVYANVVAALSCRALGAGAGVSSREEVEEWVRRHSG